MAETAFKMDDVKTTLAVMENGDDFFTVTVKLKPYLQEFLKAKLKDAMITANKNNLVGVTLRPFLEVRPKDVKPEFHCDDPDWITIRLPKYDDLNVRNSTVYVSEENQKYFQAIMETHFKDFFYSYMDDKVRYGKGANLKKGIKKRIIMQFCADFNLPFNNINYEMLQKSYYRRSKELKKNHPFLSSKLSAMCPLFFLL